MKTKDTVLMTLFVIGLVLGFYWLATQRSVIPWRVVENGKVVDGYTYWNYCGGVQVTAAFPCSNAKSKEEKFVCFGHE